MADVDVLGYLMSKGIQPKRAGGDEYHFACPFCSEDETKRGRCYINAGVTDDAGLYFCHLCGSKGNIISLKHFYGDATVEHVDADDERIRTEMMGVAATFYHEQLGENPDAYDWLRNKRGLELDTILDHQIGWAEGGTALYRHLKDSGYSTKDILKAGLCYEDSRAGRLADSLSQMVTIPYHVAGNVVLIRGRTFPYKGDGYPADQTKEGPKYKTPVHQKGRLFNSAAVWGADEICITEGEFDALILTQNGFAAVGVPGANSWQDTWDGYLADAKRVYLIFDNDTAGKEASQKLRDRFGPKVRLVEMPEARPGQAKIDPTVWMTSGKTADEFRGLLESSDESGLLVTVDQAFKEHCEIQGQTGMKFDVESLDEAILPGLLRSQVVICLAKTGTGKTIWILNMLQRMATSQPDLRFLFVSLEQTRGEWFERARRIYRFYNLSASDDDALDFWRERLLIVDKNRLTERDLNAILDDYDYRMGRQPDVMMLDYLGYFAQSFKGERYERTSDAMMALKGLSKDRRIGTVAPHQVSRMTRFGQEPESDGARDTGVIEETADFVLTLWSTDHATTNDQADRTGLVQQRIGKSRHGGRGKLALYQWAPLSLALVPMEQKGSERFCQLARNEIYYDSRQIADTWELAHARHRGELEEGAKAKELPDRSRRALVNKQKQLVMKT